MVIKAAYYFFKSIAAQQWLAIENPPNTKFAKIAP
jgi:hypothetical protein